MFPISQDEFFHALNSLLQESRQIIMTFDRTPKKISHMDDRLTSRFSWGLSSQVDPPDKEMRVAILLKKLGAIGMDLPLEAAHVIAEHVPGNVRELEGGYSLEELLHQFPSVKREQIIAVLDAASRA